jgi:ribonuclease HII
MIRCILIFATSVLFYSCKERVPSGIIKQNKMQEVLWDMLRADALSHQLANSDSTKLPDDERAKLTRQVFIIHNITENQFDKSYSYYAQHPEIMRNMLDSLNSQKIRVDTLPTSIDTNYINKDSIKQKILKKNE